MTQTDQPRRIIGLTGGVGSGKSLVAQMFAELGCPVIDADKVGHALLAKPEIIAALAERFGDGILATDGGVDRQALSAQAFIDDTTVAALNAITHPALRAELVRQIHAPADLNSGPAIVLDAALLLETDWHELCDVLIFVDAPLPDRQRRVAAQRGWPAEELARRENLQKTLDFKRSRSDHILRNNSGVSHLRQQVRLVHHSIVHPKRSI